MNEKFVKAGSEALHIGDVSPRIIDWEEMRNNFFNECTGKSGKKVAMAPQDLFEWFRSEISEYVG